MAGRPEADMSEYSQFKLEAQICEACELHDWATAASVADPVDILIMFEDSDEDFDNRTFN